MQPYQSVTPFCLVCTYATLAQAHPFFVGMNWADMTQFPPPYVPQVEHELDTQNFEHFDEDMQSQVSRLDCFCMCACVCVSVCVFLQQSALHIQLPRLMPFLFVCPLTLYTALGASEKQDVARESGPKLHWIHLQKLGGGATQ